MSKYKELLKKIGFDDKAIKAIEKAETDKTDIDLDPLIEEFNTSQKTLYENDNDLVSSIAAKEKGKTLDIVTRSIKKEFGLDSALIKDKSVDDVIKIAKTESTKGMDKNLQTVQEENLQLSNKLKELEEVHIPKIKEEVEREKKIFKFENKLTKILPVNDLRVPVGTALKNLLSDLNQKYDWDLTDKEEVLLFGKGTKLQAKTADGTKLLTVNDAMAEILKDNQFIKASNADDKRDDKKTVNPEEKDDKAAGGKSDIKLPHLREAQKHADALKKSSAS